MSEDMLGMSALRMIESFREASCRSPGGADPWEAPEFRNLDAPTST
jgi:hypothetical protein